ncbi:VPLPA-CTERM sorting domain-containing protein [uncultured Rhodospira sp.]|uniref:VPLPA-CTERM sorting domain-containing protein n=1 Tax=uncultured Rhodospira sp. TaxID=1936189 RepID=UPI0026046033|nr:VPLPA-CTERM sorting domain-containing protein [uncultured Rhodospira sp.]
MTLMKKAALFAGAAALGGVLASAPAQAAVVDMYHGTTGEYATYRGHETTFWTGKILKYEEDFEDETLGVSETIATSGPGVGTFTSTVAGQHDKKIGIFDQTGPQDGYNAASHGRYDVTNGISNNGRWLDSYDSKEVTWTLTSLTSFDSISFWMTDVNDVNGSLTFNEGAGSTETIIEFPGAGGSASNASLFFISIVLDAAVTEFTFEAASSTDGWGIDDIKVGATPLPAAAWFMLTALGGLVGTRWLKRDGAAQNA